MTEEPKLRHLVNVQEGRDLALVSERMSLSRIALFSRWAEADIVFSTPNFAGYAILQPRDAKLLNVKNSGVTTVHADVVHIFVGDNAQEGDTND